MCIAVSILHENRNNVDCLGKCCWVYLYLHSIRVIRSASWILFQIFLTSYQHLITFCDDLSCVYLYPPCSVIVDLSDCCSCGLYRRCDFMRAAVNECTKSFLICSPCHFLSGVSGVWEWMATVESMVQNGNVHKVLAVKSEGTRPFGNLTRRWDDNIKLDRK
jgi:hypothetical protein